jgi:hypothetical protein
MYAGAGLFVVGLAASHVVVGLTRAPVRAGKPIPRRLTVLMWSSLAAVLVGLGAAVAGYLLLGA